jgi:esterase/lipase superfamily enzyme
MKREYHRWFSPALHRDMELLVFGHHGARVIAFPTSGGRFFDWENNGLVRGALHEHLERGWLQLVCVDSVDMESWYARWAHPHDRVRRHDQYDRYVRTEVGPFTQALNPDPFLIVTGASFGGYHAVNFALRYPDQVNRVLSMSGLCDVRRFVDGYSDDLLYFHNPVDYLANEHDSTRLDAMRKMDVILAVGRDDRLQDSNQRLTHLLWSKGVGNALRIWDGFAHDWPVWDRMLRLYIGGHD